MQRHLSSFILRVGLDTEAIMNTTGPWIHSERKVFCDNLFTSLPLVEELLLRHTTIVGTLRKSKADIPREMQSANNGPEHSSIFGFAGNVAMTSYVPSKEKAVMTLSIVHHGRSRKYSFITIARKVALTTWTFWLLCCRVSERSNACPWSYSST